MTTLLQAIESRPKLETDECVRMDARRRQLSCSTAERQRIEEQMFRSVVPMAYKFANSVCGKLSIKGEAAEDVQSEAISEVARAIDRYDSNHDSKCSFSTFVYNYLWRWSSAATQKYYKQSMFEILTDYDEEENQIETPDEYTFGSMPERTPTDTSAKLMQEAWKALEEMLNEEDLELVKARYMSADGKTWKELYEMSTYNYKGKYPVWSFEHNIKAKLKKVGETLERKGIPFEKLLDNIAE